MQLTATLDCSEICSERSFAKSTLVYLNRPQSPVILVITAWLSVAILAQRVLSKEIAMTSLLCSTSVELFCSKVEPAMLALSLPDELPVEPVTTWISLISDVLAATA